MEKDQERAKKIADQILALHGRVEHTIERSKAKLAETEKSVNDSNLLVIDEEASPIGTASAIFTASSRQFAEAFCVSLHACRVHRADDSSYSGLTSGLAYSEAWVGAALNSFSRTTRSCSSTGLLIRYLNWPSSSGSSARISYVPKAASRMDPLGRR
jgi:hypothetical protein